MQSTMIDRQWAENQYVMCISCFAYAGTQHGKYSGASHRGMVDQSGGQVQSLSLVMIGLLYMAYPNGCRHVLHACRG